MKSLICQAIDGLKLISFSYQDDLGTRVVEPHAHGVTDEGNDVLRAWQVSGPSDSAPFRPGWRIFSVSDMRGLSVSKDSFGGARPRYKRGDTAMQRIYCQL